MDTSELPMHTQRITNRNKFVLGPSGTGKSFLMNRYLKQCRSLGADVVIIDTGDSYLGTCKYFGGRYITYTAEKPITMNPFNITAAENNEEKRELLKSLIALIWKGADGSINQVEDSILGFQFLRYDNYEAAYEAASIYREMRSKGVTVRSSNDCLIAWLSISNNFPLLHNDKDFDNIAKHTSLKIYKQNR